MNKNRLDVILELILQYNIDRQETLQKLLNERGFNVTQATVSRDIKKLKLQFSLRILAVMDFLFQKSEK